VKLAIVIVAYNRDKSLGRLLNSLSRIEHDQSYDIPLVISIDKNENKSVYRLADDFVWSHGNKIVIEQEKNLGLRAHVLKCADLVFEYENIIMLEDDLIVSKYILNYVQQAYEKCKEEPQVNQISLYANNFNETAALSFDPCDDGQDNFYHKVPSSWGQLWNIKWWREFKDWYEKYEENKEELNKLLPLNVKNWPETSWKKIYFNFLIDKNKYVFYPRKSLTSNCMDEGTHHKGNSFYLQVPTLDYNLKDYNFSSLQTSHSIYDEYCERCDLFYVDLIKKNLNLSDADKIVIDLYGSKNLDFSDGSYLLTCKKSLPAKLLKSYVFLRKPHEMNINEDSLMENLNRGDFFLYYIESKLKLDEKREDTTQRKILYYFGMPVWILPKGREVSKKKRVISKKEAIKVLFSPRFLKNLRKIKIFLYGR
jgi:hypothetical protein